MTEENQTQTNQLVTTEPYKLSEFAAGGTLEFITTGNVSIPLSIPLLQAFVSKKPNDPLPTKAEMVTFCNMIVEQNCNVYLGECWLICMKGVYKPVIAAQKRIAKAQSMGDYNGYEWGWIGKDGTRCPSGPDSTLVKDDIDGVWGRVYFKGGKVPFYHEIFRSEYKHTTNDRPITMLMKTARDQVHKYAFANEMGNLCTENEVYDERLPAPVCDTPKRNDRIKVENTHTPSQGAESEAAGTEADSGGSADEDTIRAMAEGCCEQLREILSETFGQISILPEKITTLFCKLCAIVLGGDEMKYTMPESLTVKKLMYIKEVIETGIPQEILDAFEPEQQGASEEELEVHSKKKLETYCRYVCKNCHHVFNELGTNGNCPKCLRKSITDNGPQKAEESETK